MLKFNIIIKIKLLIIPTHVANSCCGDLNLTVPTFIAFKL